MLIFFRKVLAIALVDAMALEKEKQTYDLNSQHRSVKLGFTQKVGVQIDIDNVHQRDELQSNNGCSTYITAVFIQGTILETNDKLHSLRFR